MILYSQGKGQPRSTKLTKSDGPSMFDDMRIYFFFFPDQFRFYFKTQKKTSYPLKFMIIQHLVFLPPRVYTVKYVALILESLLNDTSVAWPLTSRNL